MKAYHLAFASLVLAAPAFAQQPPAKLTVVQLQMVDRGLADLDGQQKAVNVDGKKDPVLIIQPYVFDGSTREKIVRNRIAVEAALTAQAAIYKGFAVNVKGAVDEAKQLADENASLMESSVAVDIRPIALSELKLDVNAIPSSVTSELAPTLDLGAAH